ncbi:PD-(D/E)XK motif protein [Mucilaginibacter sp.]|uniref:PD-(D/E)XK motif protein n=1 Tax=Mucilaginibacter sp. TaxID=1882438 RepID=UPI003B00BBF5
MTEETNNPWAKINLASSKRVEIKTAYRFHWIKDDKGRSGLRINFKNIPADAEPIAKISGITSLIHRHENVDDELFLVIMNPSDQDIFHTLCLDLINSSLTAETEPKLYSTVANRLRHWQRFLSMGAAKTMTEQLQMGLFAELAFLNDNVLTAMPIDPAIGAWVGPDFDKQDFSFDDFLAEIKSYITSKGPFVKISSMHQLLFDTKRLYLVAFGVSKTNGGRNILDLIDDIREKLSADSRLLDSFEGKLNQYGYFDGITEGPFFKYTTDSRKSYNVSVEFPRITSAAVADQITAVQYTIDLSKCKAFETNIPSLNNI